MIIWAIGFPLLCLALMLGVKWAIGPHEVNF